MQHKSLFAALMVGALVLASCVKNQESQSVTDVRNARADEIKSQAELNRANAEAAVMLAKAQAAIAAAQAELLKAQQAIVEAEAAKMQAEAELAAVEVEIAKVKLEGERVKLQAKKAELEALIAKYEADIAKYEVEKEKAINELEKAEAEAEINEVKSQIELLQQKKNLFDAIKALEDAKQAEITALWANYENAVKDLNKAQSDLISAQASLARMEAGEETAAEILVKQIQDKNAEIFSQKLYIEQLKDNVNISAAQLDALINAARTEYETALTEELQATEAQTFIQGQITERVVATYAYQEEWNDPFGPIAGFNSLDDIIKTNDDIKVFKKADKYNPETGRLESGVYFYYPGTNVDGGEAAISATFLPLFTKENTPEAHTEYVDWYVPQVDGVAGNGVPIFYQKVYPAKVYVDNFKTVLPIYKEIKEEKAAADRKALQRQYDRIAARVEKILERDFVEISAHKEYIENASEDINNAIQAINVANEGVFLAKENYELAESSYWYFLNNYDGDLDAEKAEKDALFDYRESLATFEKAEEAYEEARLVIFGTPVNDEVTNEEAEPIIVEGLIAKVQRLENRAYLARKDAAEAYANLDTLKAAWDDAKAELVQAVEKATTDLENGKDAVIAAKIDAQDKLEAYHWAEIVYTATTDPEKKVEAKTKMNEAKATYEGALEMVNLKEDAIPGLETALADAVAAQAKVEDPYLVAKAAFELLDVIADACYNDWQEAEKDLADAFVTLKQAEITYDDATTELAGKYAALVAAQVANADAPEDLNNLRIEYNKAYEAIFTARKAVKEAAKGYTDLIVGENAKYPKYLLYMSEVDPDYAASFDEIDAWTYKIDEYVIERVEAKAPGQLFARYMWLQDTFGAFTEEFEKAIANDNLAVWETLFERYEEALDRIHSEETAYLESMEVLQEAYDELNDAQIAKADATLDVQLAESAYNALAALKTTPMFVVTDDPNQRTIEQFEDYIKTQEQTLIDLEKDLARLYNELEYGKKNPTTGEYTAAKMAELEANIEKYETAIEFLSARIEYYLEAIAAIMAGPVE